jgi:hypothetical protein
MSGGVEIAKAMFLPDTGASKVMIGDTKESGDPDGTHPGIFIGIQQRDMNGIDISGKYHFYENDGSYGYVVVDNATNKYTGSRFDADTNFSEQSLSGTITRNDPFIGWGKAIGTRGGGFVLLLPEVGVYISGISGDNWIEIGTKVVEDIPDDTEQPEIEGFNFPLQQGDFWEFGWDYSHTYTSAHSSSSGKYNSTFRVTLGAPMTVNGTTFYEMLISGNTVAGDRANVKPNGKYISVSDNKILVLDSGGANQQTLFDGQTGFWPGSGFFAQFPESTLFTATLSTISNDYINSAAYKVSESDSSSQCQYFPGIGNICGGDYNENMDEREYYYEGVGPVGYYSHFSMSDWSSPDGGWSASNTTNIGLTASSFRGDSVDYVLEVEPNNEIDAATAITLPAKVRGDNESEDDLGGTTTVSLEMTSVDETEPNNSPSAPQTVAPSSAISGDTENGDANYAVEIPAYGGVTAYTATFEDWFQVTLGSSSKLDVTLDFAGTGADLDLYLFSFSGSNLIIQARSIEDNVADATSSEMISKSLSSDTYYVAVDAYKTDSGRADYDLAISTGANTVNVGDWFSFSLGSQAEVFIKVTGGPAFVLTDATATLTLASGGSSGESASLPAGSYLIGVTDDGPYTLEVTSN